MGPTPQSSRRKPNEAARMPRKHTRISIDMKYRPPTGAVRRQSRDIAGSDVCLKRRLTLHRVAAKYLEPTGALFRKGLSCADRTASVEPHRGLECDRRLIDQLGGGAKPFIGQRFRARHDGAYRGVAR